MAHRRRTSSRRTPYSGHLFVFVSRPLRPREDPHLGQGRLRPASTSGSSAASSSCRTWTRPRWRSRSTPRSSRCCSTASTSAACAVHSTGSPSQADRAGRSAHGQTRRAMIYNRQWAVTIIAASGGSKAESLEAELAHAARAVTLREAHRAPGRAAASEGRGALRRWASSSRPCRPRSRSCSGTSSGSARRRCRRSPTAIRDPARAEAGADRGAADATRERREEAPARHPADRAQGPRRAEGLPEVRRPRLHQARRRRDDRAVRAHPGAASSASCTSRRSSGARCGETIITADAPAKVFDKARFGPNFMAQVVVSKCADSLPLYRQAKAYRRVGVQVNDSTLGDLFHRTAEIVEAAVRSTAARWWPRRRSCSPTRRRSPRAGQGQDAHGLALETSSRATRRRRRSSRTSSRPAARARRRSASSATPSASSSWTRTRATTRSRCLAAASALAASRTSGGSFFDAQSTAPEAAKRAMDFILERLQDRARRARRGSARHA